jgi:hypothetical protein
VRAAAGRTETLKRSVRRAKRGTAPSEPNSIAAIPNPLLLQYTLLQEDQFLIYDIESTTERILMFPSEMGIQQLGTADTWFMDGTHSTGLFVLSFQLSIFH